MNFLANLIEAQYIDQITEGNTNTLTRLGRTLDSLNLFFTVVFTLELMVNALAHWFLPFVKNPWSMMDGIVVVLSLVALGPVNLPVSILRLLRAFRVIRLFGRLTELKQMISAISASIVPMMNAFLILFIVTAIYSVMGVSLFSDDSYQDFGRFTNAFVTMFHLTSEGTWPPNVPAYREDGEPNWDVSAFSMSYVLVVNWVILQVSVAVLLDNFVTASTNIEEEERQKRLQEIRRKQHATPIAARHVGSIQDVSDHFI